MFGARAIQKRREAKEAELKNKLQGGPPPVFARTGPPGCKGGKKGKKNKKGKKEIYDLIVNIDLGKWNLSNEQVSEFKEVFMLFDRDEDGVLSFAEATIVLETLGQRPTEQDLLRMVREVSEDFLYDTIEFNEFLQMMSKQKRKIVDKEALAASFKNFDTDQDGFLSLDELKEAVTTFGDKLSEDEVNEMTHAATANVDDINEGFINYEEFSDLITRK